MVSSIITAPAQSLTSPPLVNIPGDIHQLAVLCTRMAVLSARVAVLSARVAVLFASVLSARVTDLSARVTVCWLVYCCCICLAEEVLRYIEEIVGHYWERCYLASFWAFYLYRNSG